VRGRKGERKRREGEARTAFALTQIPGFAFAEGFAFADYACSPRYPLSLPKPINSSKLLIPI